jgi:hypothetical protein
MEYKLEQTIITLLEVLGYPLPFHLAQMQQGLYLPGGMNWLGKGQMS